MALNTNMPQATQSLAVTQPLILSNFGAINTAFAVDHINFNDPGQGKHNKITFPVQVLPIVINVGDLALYSLLNTTTAKHELNVYKANNAGYVNVPFTASVLSNSLPVQNGAGWSYLPSGLIIQWGNAIAASSSGTTIYNFPLAFPTAALNLQISLQETVTSTASDYYYFSKIVSAATFEIENTQVVASAIVPTFYFFAIGY